MISRTHSQGEIEYVVAAVVVANVSSAFIIPVTLPFLIGTEVRISILEVLEPVFVGALLGGWRNL